MKVHEGEKGVLDEVWKLSIFLCDSFFFSLCARDMGRKDDLLSLKSNVE